ITNVYVTPGNIHDFVPYRERLDRQINRFGFQVEEVALDAGYLTMPICQGLKEREIFAVIAHRSFRPKKGLFFKWQFKYIPEKDVYLCPAKHELSYKTTNRSGYREYKSNPQVCKNCPFLSKCTHSKTYTKTITRHVWEDAKEWARQNRLSERGKQLYKRRSQTIERSFADAKELHGLRYARYRGLAKVREQCLLIAVAQNIKKNGLAPLEERKRLCDPPNLPNLISFICLFPINMQPLTLFLRKEPGGLSSISTRSLRPGLFWPPGSDLLSRGLPPPVPSALEGLTSVFGMGTGGSPPLLPPDGMWLRMFRTLKIGYGIKCVEVQGEALDRFGSVS